MLPALPVHHPRPLIKGWGNGETLLFSIRPEPLRTLRPVWRSVDLEKRWVLDVMLMWFLLLKKEFARFFHQGRWCIYSISRFETSDPCESLWFPQVFVPVGLRGSSNTSCFLPFCWTAPSRSGHPNEFSTDGKGLWGGKPLHRQPCWSKGRGSGGWSFLRFQIHKFLDILEIEISMCVCVWQEASIIL